MKAAFKSYMSPPCKEDKLGTFSHIGMSENEFCRRLVKEKSNEFMDWDDKKKQFCFVEPDLAIAAAKFLYELHLKKKADDSFMKTLEDIEEKLKPTLLDKVIEKTEIK